MRTESVLTTASFAESPAIRAVDARQSLKPRGAKTGEAIFPREARRLFSLLSVRERLESKLCRNQIMIEAINMTVKAFLTKLKVLPATFAAMNFSEGVLNIFGSALMHFIFLKSEVSRYTVRLNIREKITAMKIPVRYTPSNAAILLSLKKTEINIVYTGNFCTAR